MNTQSSTPDFNEAVGGRVVDGSEAMQGTPVITSDGLRAGVVSGAQGKYIEVTPDSSDAYWLSVVVTLKADPSQVTLNCDAQALAGWALAEPEGADAGDPDIDAQSDALSSEADKERRREGLVQS